MFSMVAYYKIVSCKVIPYKKYILIDRDSPHPVYEQLAEQLALAIQRGYLPDGLKLPGSRKMAELLSLHRNTVAAGYELLASQGWLVARPSRGTFVQSAPKPSKSHSLRAGSTGGFPVATAFDFRRQPLLDNPFRQTMAEISIDDGLPDVRLLRMDYLARLFHTNMKRRGTLTKLAANSHAARNYYREHLSNYLNLTRGVRIRPDQLLATRSLELGLYVIAETLLEAGDTVVVGELSYFATNMILQKTGARIQTVPLDQDGIRVDALEEICKRQKIRMLYVTPHHHYPTTAVLSESRRSRLLDLAYQYGFIILEDDHDFDFNYGDGPLLPMAARDTQGVVIYAGTFGRTMPSAFRSGFVIAPTELLRELEKLHGIMDRYGDPLGELVMGELIAEGEMHRYLQQSTTRYRRRRNRMAEALAGQMGHRIDFEVPESGLAIWTTWPSEINLLQFSKACSREGLFLPSYLLYQSATHCGVRLGFGSLDLAQIDRSVEIMAKVLIHRGVGF